MESFRLVGNNLLNLMMQGDRRKFIIISTRRLPERRRFLAPPGGCSAACFDYNKTRNKYGSRPTINMVKSPPVTQRFGKQLKSDDRHKCSTVVTRKLLDGIKHLLFDGMYRNFNIAGSSAGSPQPAHGLRQAQLQARFTPSARSRPVRVSVSINAKIPSKAFIQTHVCGKSQSSTQVVISVPPVADIKTGHSKSKAKS